MVPGLTCDHRPNTAADGPRLGPQICDATRYSSLAGPSVIQFIYWLLAGEPVQSPDMFWWLPR